MAPGKGLNQCPQWPASLVSTAVGVHVGDDTPGGVHVDVRAAVGDGEVGVHVIRVARAVLVSDTTAVRHSEAGKPPPAGLNKTAVTDFGKETVTSFVHG